MPVPPNECDGIMCQDCAPNGCKVPEVETDMRKAWEDAADAVVAVVRKDGK